MTPPRLAIGRDPAIVRRAVLGPCWPRGHPASALAGVAVIGGAEQLRSRDLSRNSIRLALRYPADAANPFATLATLST